MSHYSIKLVFVSILAFLMFSMVSRVSSANDLLAQAAARFREKEYSDAIELAKKANESPKRTFLLGVTLLRMERADESLPLLAEAEVKLPLVADYASLFQAEALFKLKKFTEAAGKAASTLKEYPASLLVRRTEKMYADTIFEAGDFAKAFRNYQAFIEKYPSGTDSVDALFQTARCQEEIGDEKGSIVAYRNIWLNNPASVQSKKSQVRLNQLEKKGFKIGVYNSVELMRRASLLTANNDYFSSLQVLQSIPTEARSTDVSTQIDFRRGMNEYRLRDWKQAEINFVKASAGGSFSEIRSEARFWLAKSLEHQDLSERAFILYMEIAGEGRKQAFADQALMEAAGLRRSQGRYSEAALLFAQISTGFPDSKFFTRAKWEVGWCRYLAGDYFFAAESFRPLLNDENFREKALYWLARSVEHISTSNSGAYYRTLLEEYPTGFYASWYRAQKSIQDLREPLGMSHCLNELPLIDGFEKAKLLASLGMVEESRSEMAVARTKTANNKSLFPGLARIYLEIQDYRSAIALFLQNRPVKWDKVSLPLWLAGYPLVFSDLVARNSSANGLSEGLIFALIRAESGFSTSIKSPVGAIGLMQLMPKTAKSVAHEKGIFDPQRLIIPEINIKLGTKHFCDLIKYYNGEEIYSIAAYNAGETAVDRWRKNSKKLQMDEFIESIPYQETRDYVKKVFASAVIYRKLYGLK